MIHRLTVLSRTMSSSSMCSPIRAPAVFIPHGGGPMPILGDSGHAALVAFLRSAGRSTLGLAPSLTEPHLPRALIVVSAHFDANVPTVSSREDPKLFYDYYGFPPEAYTLTLNARGDKTLASEVVTQLKESGFPNATTDATRGWDHGVFVPLIAMFQNMKIPVPIIPVSIPNTEDPTVLFKMGHALGPLRDRGFAIMGSGMSYHNFAGFFETNLAKRAQYVAANTKFEERLNDVLATGTTSSGDRLSKLANWMNWPGARECQPARASEHFNPLMILAATHKGDEPAKRVGFTDTLGFMCSSYSFN